MLPVALTLSNFLSYADDAPALLLDGVHVACLCGPNGHGKSALLDAVTWALWGRARAQRQDQLIHQGRDEMAIELTFDARGQRYRLIRRYSRARRQGQTSLELFVATSEQGSGGDKERGRQGAGSEDDVDRDLPLPPSLRWHALTEDTISATQAHVQRLISMDYDTFVNSAFLVQGRADLFTMATPAQRKEVLGRVLGLWLYDRLEERAKARERDAQARSQSLGLVVDRLREQVAQRGATREALDAVAGDLAKLDEALDRANERLELLQRQLAFLERRREETRALAEQETRIAQRKADAEAEAALIGRRLVQWREATAEAEAIEEGFAALQRARDHWKALNDTAQRVHAIERELFPIEQRITAAKASLERDVAELEGRVTGELAPKANAADAIEAKLHEVEKRLQALADYAAETQQIEARRNAATAEAQRLEQENAALVKEGTETRNKIELLSHAHAAGATCPLCGTTLDARARARLQASYQSEIAGQRQRYADRTVKMRQLQQDAEALEKQAVERRQRIESQRTSLDRERARLSVEKEQASMAQAQLAEASQRLDELRGVLDREAFAVDDRREAERLRLQLAEAAFDPASLPAAEAAVAQLEAWSTKHQTLEEARRRLADDDTAFQRAQSRAAEASADLAQAALQRAALAKELEKLPAQEAEHRKAASEVRTLTEERNALQARHGSLTHQLEAIDDAERDLDKRDAERADLAREIGAFGELAQALGKAGVQALLIEAAVPRLEDEANALLKRMTDGRMSLSLQTQRVRRATRRGGDGNLAETLDITIDDELGTRPYELFSGGERFRVDFALRIALSKLLAWRAGAPLPTLFIDEGFGTQDTHGRERILDVIKAIEPEFQRILVITHMDEIKDAFPVRIEVTKTAAGSTFAMT